MGLIGGLTQAVTLTVGDPSVYNANFEAIRAAFDNTAVLTDTARTVVAQHTFNPASAQAPFTLGANAIDQLVTGLNAEKLLGRDLIGTFVTHVLSYDTDTTVINTTDYYPIFRMPFAGWLGRPVIQLVSAYVGGTSSLQAQIFHGNDSATSTDITTTPTKIEAGEDNSEDNAQKHIYSGADQADAQRSAGDWIWIRHTTEIGSPTTSGKGLIVSIPVYGYNPHI
jgi:hypothetical protein